MNKTNGDSAFVIGIVCVLLILIFVISFGCYYGMHTYTITGSEQFSSEERPKQGLLYNALYTSSDLRMPGSYLYTQPPGDTKAQEWGLSGQGTSGEFFPLQGIGAGIYMKNSQRDNLAVPSPQQGVIGGQPNYTDQQYSSRWIGFNNFGFPFSMQQGPDIDTDRYTNSYTLSGANERVCNSGQKCDNLRSQDWWPWVSKGDKGFTVQDSDAMVPCPYRDVNLCKGKGANRFLRDKFDSRWKRVVNPV